MKEKDVLVTRGEFLLWGLILIGGAPFMITFLSDLPIKW